MNIATETETDDPTVLDEHGMTCPKCHRDDKLEVAAIIWVRLVPDGTEDSENGDQTWDDDSPCLCNHEDCDWSGKVKDAREAAE